MASTTDEFVCFNRRGKSNGHFFSCHDLYDRGVWVGHLTPDKLSERYKGLPSFNELKTNCKKFNEPYPASIAGVPGDERHAVCRGCVGSQSQLITLREIKFTGKTVSQQPTFFLKILKLTCATAEIGHHAAGWRARPRHVLHTYSSAK
jgi:hypothetical protein